MSTPSLAPRPGPASIDVLVGKRVHTLMWDSRVKNKDLALLLEIDPTAVGKKLRAEQKFSIDQLRLIADRLDTTIAYLVGETDDSVRPRDPRPGGDDPSGIRHFVAPEPNQRPSLYRVGGSLPVPVPASAPQKWAA